MRKLTTSIALSCALLLSAPLAQASVGPGCAANRPAIAHYAGGVVLAHQPPGAPVPCGMQTGYAGGESAIAVTNTGAVFYAPAVYTFAGVQAQYFLGGGSGFARSTDLGRSWQFVDPLPVGDELTGFPRDEGYPAWDQIDDKFYMDRLTGRLFWADPDLPSETVLWTDNSGASRGSSVLPIGFGGEWTQVTTAKPRISTTSGYPEVVYACGEYDSIARDVSTSFEGDLCQKSLDGGQTWISAGQGLFGSPLARHSECGGQTESPNFSPWAAPDPQGRLNELLFCAGRTYLIRSSDEGASWPIAAEVPYQIPNVGPGNTGSAELRTDAQGNLYLAWAVPGNPNPNAGYQPGKVYMATSVNGGASWSAPLDVLAPGVQGIRTHFGFDVGAPGHVAISYLGQRGGRAGFDGYITETYDALASRPLFWSATVNSPSEVPLDNGSKGSSNGLGLDYVSVAIGPDGTPWASFWDDCGEQLPQSTAGCPTSREPPPDVTTFGFRDYAGRLAAAPASTTRSRTHRRHRTVRRVRRRHPPRRTRPQFTG